VVVVVVMVVNVFHKNILLNIFFNNISNSIHIVNQNTYKNNMSSSATSSRNAIDGNTMLGLSVSAKGLIVSVGVLFACVIALGVVVLLLYMQQEGTGDTHHTYANYAVQELPSSPTGQTGQRVLDLSTFKIYEIMEGKFIMDQNTIHRNTPVFISDTGSFYIENQYTQTNAPSYARVEHGPGLSYNDDGSKLDIITPTEPNIVTRMAWTGQNWVPEPVYHSFIHSFTKHPLSVELAGIASTTVSSFTTPVMHGVYDITFSLTGDATTSTFEVILRSQGDTPVEYFKKEFTVLVGPQTIKSVTDVLDFPSGVELDVVVNVITNESKIHLENFSIRKSMATTSSE
jgi:hypothetical protein